MKKTIRLISLFVMTVTLLASCKQKTESGFAEINGTKLYYEIRGKGTPMIFLHDFACDHRNWNPQVDYFSKKYQVITYDARGHGQSTVPDTIPYSYEDDLAALIDYLNIEKAVIIGHSMGGGPAFYYTLHHPDKVIGLCLAEGGAFLSDPAIVDTSNISVYFTEIYSAIRVARKEGIEKGKEAWLNIHPMKNAAENPISSELLKNMINDYSGWHWLNKDPQKYNPDGTIEIMQEIKVPTLLIAGELSHPVFKDWVSAQSKYIPNSKLVVLKNSNHMINIENPDQFNKELNLFLNDNNIK